jgi:hypothetical protein
VLARRVDSMDAELDGAKLRHQLDERSSAQIVADLKIRLQDDALMSECSSSARIAVVRMDARPHFDADGTLRAAKRPLVSAGPVRIGNERMVCQIAGMLRSAVLLEISRRCAQHHSRRGELATDDVPAR